MHDEFPFHYDDVGLLRRTISNPVLEQLPRDISLKKSMIPFGYEGDLLCPAVLESCPHEDLELARFVANRDLKVYVIPKSAMALALSKHYP